MTIARKREDIVVFSARKAPTCDECGEDFGRRALIRVIDGNAVCMECADLDHLVYLPRGNAALTRRAGKYSRLRAVVVRWSPARKRYERQGTLVEEAALDRAEEECLADADLRAERREREAERRAEVDQRYVTEFAAHIRARYPRCPKDETRRIAEHACRKHSGRVGRTAAAKEFDLRAIDLAVAAHIRHVHTTYDELLMDGWDRHDARHRVAADVDSLTEEWSGSL
jgi:hypothetical protein